MRPEASLGRRLPRWMLTLHTYGGLLVSSYLVLYGVTSLLANHRPNRLLDRLPPIEVTADLASPTGPATPAGARAAAEALGLVGRIPDGQIRSNPDGTWQFTVARPGRDVRVRIGPRGDARLTISRQRLGGLLLGLHNAQAEPTSAALMSWWYFTGLTVLVMVGIAVTGVWVWASRRRLRRAGGILLVGVPVVIAALAGWLLR